MVQKRPVRVERKLSAILAADVAGYARLMHTEEEATHARLTSLLTDAVAAAIAEHGGRIVKNNALDPVPGLVVCCCSKALHRINDLCPSLYAGKVDHGFDNKSSTDQAADAPDPKDPSLTPSGSHTTASGSNRRSWPKSSTAQSQPRERCKRATRGSTIVTVLPN